MKPLGIFLMAMALAMPQLAFADECSNAVTDYNTVLPHLNDATQHFTSCVANSLGLDTCAKEFSKLRSAYGEFESAVVIYIKQCR
jgi:hypothetical protein